MWSWSSSLLPPIRSMLSVNCRLHMGLLPIEMDEWWSWNVSCMIFSRNKLNWMGKSKHPWRIPTLVWKNSPIADCWRGLQCWSSHAVPEWLEPVLPLCWSLRTCHRPARQTLSNFYTSCSTELFNLGATPKQPVKEKELKTFTKLWSRPTQDRGKAQSKYAGQTSK